MASGKTHAILGGVVGFVVYGCYKLQKNEKLTFGDTISAIGGGTVCGILADILEPALRNPQHRKFLHSVTWAYILYKLTGKIEGDSTLGLPFNIAIGAYLSHLAADSFTQRSLPLI